MGAGSFAAVRRLRLLGLVCLLILPTALRAQIGTQGTFMGTVKDSSGAIVSGAIVRATNIATGESQASPSNQDGLYRLPQLPPGHYRIQANQTGFRAEVHSDIELTVGQTQEVDSTLQVGATTETVTVTGEAPLVDISTSTVSSLVNQQQVQDLPLNGRDFSQLVYLTPGVANGSGGINQDRGNPQFEIAGAPATATRYMMDGSEFSGTGITTNHLPTTAALKLLGVDALAEFAVVNSNGEASVGKDEGGQINVVTRSGTNAFHGSAYEFLRSKIFNTSDYFSPEKSPFTRNNFGGSIGGPIRKNKTFFFFNYEEYQSRTQSSLSSTVPTPSVLGIGFNGVEQIPTGLKVGAVCQIAAINPVTGAQTVNVGTLSSTPVNLAAVQASNAILKFFPAGVDAADYAAGTPVLSSANGCPTGVQNVAVRQEQDIKDHFVLGRVDHQISDKQSLFGRYVIQTGTSGLSQSNHY